MLRPLITKSGGKNVFLEYDTTMKIHFLSGQRNSILYIHWNYAFLFTSTMKSYICLSFILNVLHSLLKVTFANKRKVCSKKFNDVPKSQTLEDVPDIKCFLHERGLSA